MEVTKEVEQLSKRFRGDVIKSSLMHSDVRRSSAATDARHDQKRASCNTLMSQVRASLSINNFRPAPEEEEPIANDIDDDFRTVYE